MNTIKLTINKREFNFSFGLASLGNLLDELDTDIDSLMRKVVRNPFKYYPLIMFTYAKYGLIKEGKDVDFDVHQFSDWIDSEGALTDKNKSVVKFTQMFKDSIFKDVPVEESSNDSESVKKK